MYYGSGGFGLEDLAMSEMGADPAQPVFAPTDVGVLQQDAQQAAALAAQFMLAKNPQSQTGQAIQSFLPKTPIPPPPAPGMSQGMKLALGLGIGAAAIGALIWFSKRKKKSANHGRPNDDDWRSIGD